MTTKASDVGFRLGWGELRGSAPVRYIYLDEAGRTKEEPLTVVAGIIVHADTQYELAEERLAQLLQTVPPSIRPGFVAHAKSIWGNRKIRDAWSYEDRVRFLTRLVSIPRELGIPICMGGALRKNPGDISRHHAVAFGACVAHADRFIRQFGGEREVATVVAENIPEMQTELRNVAKRLRERPMQMEKGRMLGQADSEGRYEYKITRVKDTIHFVSKEDGPFLQIADGCAWAFTRFFANKKLGGELVRAMCGPDVAPWPQGLRWMSGLYGIKTYLDPNDLHSFNPFAAPLLA
jgi:hypothetical protein